MILGDRIVDGLIRVRGGGEWYRVVGGGAMEFRDMGDYVWVNGMVRDLGSVRFSGLIRGVFLGVRGDNIR